MATKKKTQKKAESSDVGGAFHCPVHLKPVSFSVAWRDGTATVFCTGCGGRTTLKAEEFQAQLQRNRLQPS